MRGIYAPITILVLVAAVNGCNAHRYATSPYLTSPEPRTRNTVLAQQLNDDALKHIEAGELDEAQALFRKALDADLLYPAAHNNLGLVLLRQGKMYESAWEFSYAAKLMPHSAEPRHNLGSLMEKMGRFEEAEGHYEAALAIDDGNVEVIGHLARVYVKQDRRDERVISLLKKLAFQSDVGDWNRWARMWLVKLEE